jgi:hypothetical protein
MTRIELGIPKVCRRCGFYNFSIYGVVYNRDFSFWDQVVSSLGEIPQQLILDWKGVLLTMEPDFLYIDMSFDGIQISFLLLFS